MKKLLSFASFAFFSVYAFAQSTSFTYQGRLDDGANPANGLYDLRFAICDDASGGAPQGDTVTNAATAVSNGLFTVTLDFGNQFPGADRWLEIGVRTNGGGTFSTLSPRQQLTATPYAITAGNLTGTLEAGQLSGTIAATNIGAGSITSVMLANGAVSSNNLAAGSVTTTIIADGSITPSKLATATNWFAQTFISPTPASNDRFGYAMAPLGNDRVIVGAPGVSTNSGAVYLYTIAGTLLATFTNPTPVSSDLFGWSVAAVGNNCVLIGAYGDDTTAFNSGAAYLFSTNGSLITTFTNPVPTDNDNFGWSVAAMGSGRVLIGAIQDRSSPSPNFGAAYLFSTNGTLLTTFANPAPTARAKFGDALTALGSNLILIGAAWADTGATDAGVAYLFNTNGTLITTITNPTPLGFENFGKSMVAVGDDRVIIGAPNDHNGTTFVGAAYLFNTNGTLLTTLTNPTPTYDDLFGWSLAASADGNVLIGAHHDNAGDTSAGAAFLFSTNGALLVTFTNPTPAVTDYFGQSVALVGMGQVMVGAYLDDAVAPNAGAAYLFRSEAYTPGPIGEWIRSNTSLYWLGGNVGIGTDTPGFKLEVNGSAGKPGGGSWSVASDERLKRNIRPLTGTLDKLLTLHGVNFEYIAPEKIHELSGERMGLIAQEVEKVFPDWVETAPDGYKRVTVRGLEALMVEALRQLREEQKSAGQEAEAAIRKVNVEIERQRGENLELRERLEKLEQRLSN
jgi:hypothetical protein